MNCKCGHPLKKKEHLLCYKCYILNKKGIAFWKNKIKNKSFRWKKLRNKIKWNKKLKSISLNLKSDEQICSYQPAIYSNYTGYINVCKCPCNGDC